jgi:hypothetical protein
MASTDDFTEGRRSSIEKPPVVMPDDDDDDAAPSAFERLPDEIIQQYVARCVPQ